MKDAPSSRGVAATNSANHSNASSNETIGTDSGNFNGSNDSGAIGTIDPNDNSYFIQYHPEIAEKLSNHNSTYSVSGRCLSIVASRMIYWSRYAKHRFQGKLWYWKNQTELSQETGFSVKQINRALKVLVELGLLVREKFQKHYYRQVYFYHIPSSPHTKELQQPTRTVQQRAAVSSSTIHKGKGFGSIGTKCPNQSQEIPSSIKQSLLSIVQKCESYGNIDIYRERFGMVA
jgi:hypothetical protein